jgi:hypothetical protein
VVPPCSIFLGNSRPWPIPMFERIPATRSGVLGALLRRVAERAVLPAVA